MLSHTTTTTTFNITVLFFITINLMILHSAGEGLSVSAGSLIIHDYSTTSNLSSIWINTNSFLPNFTYSDGTLIRPILLHPTPGPSYACGFYCSTSPCNSYLFSIFIVFTSATSTTSHDLLLDTPHLPKLVWSANRHHSISDNATLQLTATGELILLDSDSSFVWSSNTSSISDVVSMQLLESGNLILADVHGDVVWSSFDHPTDTLLLGQSLRVGQRLTANASATDWTPGRFFLTVHADSLAAYIDSNPPQLYYQFKINGISREEDQGKNSTFIQFINGSLALFGREKMVLLPSISSPVQHITLESDGHLRLYYEWQQRCKLVGDVIIDYLDDCDYPLVCGEYGVCSQGQCSCPRGVINGTDASSSFFRPVNELQVNLGCSPATPLSCQSAGINHAFLKLDNVSYFNSIDSSTAITGLNDEESCKEACFNDCTCKAAFFKHGNHDDSNNGSCYMPSQLFSMMSDHNNSSAYIKIQTIPTTPGGSSGAERNRSSSSQPSLIIGSVLGALFVIISGLATVFLFSRRRVTPDQEDNIGSFNGMRGMPTRFSLEELRVATKDFWEKLGEGGFGSVFEGILADGMRIAVKRLEDLSQGKMEFLTEVETMGSIHHINLVRLIGFCSEKLDRLLVYEYMSNGSLDKWIFPRHQNTPLDWKTRHKIIMDVAKGLSYLHEECRQRIVHLDIKPQNILLDDKFNAKVSDFGLAKLIDREKSSVRIRLRGTPGYLAPEFLTSKITEKVDVYSFGVVIMEIVCGRKNLDNSLPEESNHLISLLQKLVESDELLSIVDNRADIGRFSDEVVEMMKLAMWCLQTDASRRPSMSMVVKVLEGVMRVESDLNYDFSLNPLMTPEEYGAYLSAQQFGSILSGPR